MHAPRCDVSVYAVTLSVVYMRCVLYVLYINDNVSDACQDLGRGQRVASRSRRPDMQPRSRTGRSCIVQCNTVRKYSERTFSPPAATDRQSDASKEISQSQHPSSSCSSRYRLSIRCPATTETLSRAKTACQATSPVITAKARASVDTHPAA